MTEYEQLLHELEVERRRPVPPPARLDFTTRRRAWPDPPKGTRPSRIPDDPRKRLAQATQELDR